MHRDRTNLIAIAIDMCIGPGLRSFEFHEFVSPIVHHRFACAYA
jgi:hypothetical protein